MRLLKPLGLSLVAACALASALSASAFGLELPENLPASTTRTWTGSNVGNTILHTQGLEPVTCTEVQAKGTETTSNPPLGAFELTFNNCASTAGGVTVKCTGLGLATGVIADKGTWHLVFDKLIGQAFENLTSALLLLSEASHLTCGGLVLFELLAGETLCLHLNPAASTTTHEFHCIGEIAGGVPKPLEEWGKDVGGVFTGGKVPVRNGSINHAAEVSTLLLGLGTVVYTGSVFADQ